MGTAIIYEKKYPPIDYNSTDEHFFFDIPDTPEMKLRSFDEVLKEIYEATEYTPIPCREDLGKEFIKLAINISDIYRMNIRILRLKCKISVHLGMDFCVNMEHINRLFGMADRISFLSGEDGRDLFARLDLYTHVVTRSGVAYAP